MVTLQISRNLFQYFAADSEIVDSTLDLSSRRGNVISIACGLSFRLPLTQSYPIGVGEGERVQIRNARGKVAAFDFEEGMGIILLKPLLGGRLETVVWGLDSQGLQQAVRLLPMLTGVCQPDFIILSRRCAWEGAAGVLAMGSFDSFWKVSEASFIS